MKNNIVTIYYGGFLRTSGGAFMHARTISTELEKKGWDVDIITLDRLPVLVRYWPHLTQYLINFFRPPMGFLYKDRLTRRLYKLFFDSDVQLRIFEDIYLAWNSNVPSVSLLHAVWSDNLQSLSINRKQQRNLVRKEVKIIKAIQHSIITVSKPYLQYLKENLFADHDLPQINVIPLGLDISAFDRVDNVKKSGKSIVYCGSLEPRKNVFFLLEVFKKLFSIDCEYKLTIVGDGPDRQGLQAFVDEYHLPVRFMGRLDHEGVLNELIKHETYLHPSVKESFSFSLLEAKLSGLKTCAYRGLEVPSEFIDIPLDSFEVDVWLRGISSANTVSSNFDGARFSSKVMTEDTLKLIRSFSSDPPGGNVKV